MQLNFLLLELVLYMVLVEAMARLFSQINSKFVFHACVWSKYRK